MKHRARPKNAFELLGNLDKVIKSRYNSKMTFWHFLPRATELNTEKLAMRSCLKSVNRDVFRGISDRSKQQAR